MDTEPRYLGHYQMLECVARGGMGEVWKAIDTRLQRTVAIKLLLSNWQQSPGFITRFQSEAQLIASLRHPNIVKIHNFHIEEPPGEAPVLYMVMDYVEGQTMAAYIANTSKLGQFPSGDDIVYLFTMVGLALDYAHEHGMIHRDIKPANVLLDQRNPHVRGMGEPILTDFGIARRQGVSGGTIMGSIVGTPLYVSPEQAMGIYDEKRSDLYSLGIILYEMVTGTQPFRGDRVMSVIMQHINQPPTPPELLNAQVSAELSQVVLKSIAKKPEERFSSASEMAVALAEVFHVPLPEPLVHNLRRIQPAAGLSLSSIHSPVQPQTSGSLANPPLTPEPLFLPSRDLPTEQSGKLELEFASSQEGRYRVVVTPAQEERIADKVDKDTRDARDNEMGKVNRTNHTPIQLIEPMAIAEAEPISSPPAGGITSRAKFKWLVTLGTGVLTMLVILSGLIWFFAAQPPAKPATASGTLHFVRGPGTQGYTSIRLDLDHIANPPAGKVYYAWIDPVSSETHRPHWPVHVVQGQIHTEGLTDKIFGNLLVPNSLFVITLEDASNTNLLIPTLDPQQRRYYVHIIQTTTTDFSLQACPDSATATTCTS